jgi:CheY-like chemotaxis protein
MTLTSVMVDRGIGIGMKRAIGARIVEERVAIDGGWDRRAWIVEDEPAAAALAAELCVAWGAEASIFRMPLAFLTALRSSPAPAVVVLDWRLENELSAALFLAIRNHYPRLPIIYWTGSQLGALPSMIQDDRYTVVVDKASGTRSFEDALGWALDDEQGSPPTG